MRVFDRFVELVLKRSKQNSDARFGEMDWPACHHKLETGFWFSVASSWLSWKISLAILHCIYFQYMKFGSKQNHCCGIAVLSQGQPIHDIIIRNHDSFGCFQGPGFENKSWKNFFLDFWNPNSKECFVNCTVNVLLPL